MVWVVAAVGSSPALPRGEVIRTWTNCSTPAMTASMEMAKPPMKIANVWSTVARLSDTPVNGLVSHSTTVSTGASSLNGVMSWAVQGKELVEVRRDGAGSVDRDLVLVVAEWLDRRVGGEERVEAGLLLVRGVIGDHAGRPCQGL